MILHKIKSVINNQHPEHLKRHEVDTDKQIHFKNSAFITLERGKIYTWEYEYNLIEGNEKSSYAAVFFI